MRALTHRTVKVGLAAALALPALAVGAGPAPVADSQTATIHLNPLGYLPREVKKAVVRASDSTAVFQLVAGDGSVVLAGDLLAAGGDFGKYRIADFSAVVAEGAYRLKVGSTHSQPFAIGADARRKYAKAVWNGACNYFRKQRCGNASTGWRGKPCHLDDGRRSDNGQHLDVVGGWHDACDYRKWFLPTVMGMLGLNAVKRSLDPPWDKGGVILGELKWGNLFFLKMQDPSGFLYSYCGAGNGSPLTDNLVGTKDDRKIAVFPANLPAHHFFVASQAVLYQLYRDQEPEYAGRCLTAAVRCYEYCRKNHEAMCDYTVSKDPVIKGAIAITLSQRGYRDTIYGSGAFCGIEMYRATRDPRYESFAVEMGDRLMALQETAYVGGQKEIRGFFYTNERRDEMVMSQIQEPIVGISLATLCEVFPKHVKCARWKEGLRLYVEDYLSKIASRNAYSLVPIGLWKKNIGGPKPRRVGGLHYRYFFIRKGNRLRVGRSHHILGDGVCLAKAAKVLNDPRYRELAWHQLEWVIGRNPLGISSVTGIGRCSRPYVGVGTGAKGGIDGGVMNGVRGDDNDMPLPPRSWAGCEYWTPNVTYFLWLTSELLAH